MINIDKILEDNLPDSMSRILDTLPDSKANIKDAMLEFGKQLLELATENVELKPYYNKNGLEVGEEIDMQTILDTINQVN